MALLLCEAAVQFRVSGMSSGGFMAGQMHVAYSETIIGAAIVSAGPYYCSLGSLSRLQTACTINPWLLSVEQSIGAVNTFYNEALIDNPENLNNDPVYIFSGTLDQVIVPGVVQQTLAFYNNFVSPNMIKTNFDTPANHDWATLTEGNPCWYLGPPYIGSCGFDLSGAILNTLYGILNAKTNYIPANLFQFPQAKFGNIWQAGLSTRGWIYIPTGCQSNPGSCKLHVNFHGCSQYYDLIGTTFIVEIGINDWAESNNIIVISPQTIATAVNPEGCWDFLGYTGPNFPVKSGLQMSAVWNMAQNYTKIAASVL